MIETIFSNVFDNTKQKNIRAATGPPTCAAAGAPTCAATGAPLCAATIVPTCAATGAPAGAATGAPTGVDSHLIATHFNLIQKNTSNVPLIATNNQLVATTSN